MKKSMILLVALLLVTQASAFTFCEDGTAGKSDLRLISIDDMLEDNSKEWNWEPSTSVEIEARVENREGSQETYILEATFRDGENKIRIAQDSDNLEKEFTLSSNERKSISLKFEIEEDADLGNYELYIKFYKKDSEETKCQENSEETIKIDKIEVCPDGKVDEDDLEIQQVQDETKDNEVAWSWTPGDDIEITLDLENKEYSERTFITELIFLDENNNEISIAENSENMIEEKQLNKDETEDFEFNFKIKPGTPEGEYTLYAKAYDEDNDNICTSLKAYDKSSPKTIEIKKAERNVVMKEIKGPAVTKTFSQVQYKATIINLGSESEERALAVIYNYQLGLLEKIELKDLESGEERTVNFNFTIAENASISQHAILFSTEFEYNEKQDYYKSSSDNDDDIKKYLTVSLGTLSEEVEPKNITTKTEVIIENETIPTEETPTTTITGNAIGSSKKTSLWPIVSLAGILIIAILFFVFKKPKQNIHIQPRIARRYSARLN